MLNILESAAKIVFIMITLSACAGLFIGVISQENFMLLATGCFAFFFANKGDPTQPYAGK
jgi:hypothetical protein